MTFVDTISMLRRFAGSTTNWGAAILAGLVFSGPEPNIGFWFGDHIVHAGWFVASAACALAGIGRAKAKGPLWPANKEMTE